MYPVTVIIPVYCATPESVVWFEECIISALKQHCNIAIYDDGSPMLDDVIRIVTYYNLLGMFDRGVDNHGPAYARNRAVELAQTDLILPLDCDDMLEDDAVSELYAVYNGVPVYPNVIKLIGDVRVNHALHRWTCERQCDILSVASVNVLHSIAQWKYVGGWDESLTANDLYEDSLYNARLFFTYGAELCTKYLVCYRQHDNSRTHNNSNNAQAMHRLGQIRGYNMACCGKSSMKVSSPIITQSSKSVQIDMDTLPLIDDKGNVLCIYEGGRGKGRHTYRGIKTKYAYSVVYGQYLYVDVADLVYGSLFRRVVRNDVKTVNVDESYNTSHDNDVNISGSSGSGSGSGVVTKRKYTKKSTK